MPSRLWSAAIAVLAVAGALLFAPPMAADAAGGATATVDSLQFTTTSVRSGDTATLPGTWSLPDDPTTPAGFTIDLPSALQGLADTFTLTSPTGAAMGTCTVSTTQLACAIDPDDIAAHPLHLNGTLSFSGTGRAR